MRSVLLLLCVACAGTAQKKSWTEVAQEIREPRDPHRKLTADECGQFYDFMKKKGWLAEPGAQRDAVVASCLEMGATEAFQTCILGSATREEADRCQ